MNWLKTFRRQHLTIGSLTFPRLKFNACVRCIYYTERYQFARYINPSTQEVLGRTCGKFFPSNPLMYCDYIKNVSFNTLFSNGVVTSAIFQMWHSTFYMRFHVGTPIFQILNSLRFVSYTHQMAATHKFRAAFFFNILKKTKNLFNDVLPYQI